MDYDFVINVCMYSLIAIGIYTVYVLRTNKDGLEYEVEISPTAFVFKYSAYGKKGTVVVIKDDVTFKPELRRNPEEWIMVLPLDYTYEQFMDFIRHVDVPPNHSKEGIEGVFLLVDILDQKIIPEDDEIYKLFNENIYLFRGENHKRYFSKFNKCITNKTVAYD